MHTLMYVLCRRRRLPRNVPNTDLFFLLFFDFVAEQDVEESRSRKLFSWFSFMNVLDLDSVSTKIIIESQVESRAFFSPEVNSKTIFNLPFSAFFGHQLKDFRTSFLLWSGEANDGINLVFTD